MRYWILAVLLGGLVSGEAHQDEGHDEIRAFRVQPVVLDPKTQSIGRIVEDFELVDIHDKPHRLSTLLADAKAVVIAVRDVKCPVSSKYAPVLSRMEKIYAAHGIQFLFLNPNRHDDKRSILKEIEAHGLDSPYVADPSGRIASILGAQSSSQVLVVDKRRRVVYDGAVDDEYGIGYARSAPLRSYLRDALNSLAGGRPITVSATSAPGCFINPNPEVVESNELTYYRDVAPIVQENCQVCHRPGESGPFPLLSFYDVSGRKEMIRYVLQNRIMPPWFAAPGAGPWKNDRTLAVTERETFLRWIDNGAPAGDIEDAPDPVQWPVGWRMGEPDLVLAVPKVFDIPAEGQLPYEYVTISPGLTQDKWVNGLEIRLDAPQLVHHILVFLVPPGYQPSDDIFSHDSPPFFAAYSPGLGPQVFTEGLARRLPRDKDLLFQIHYQPNGTPGRDTPRLGLRFHPEEPLHEVHAGTIGSYAFTIPPRENNVAVTAALRLNHAIRILGFYPHMHVRGKSFLYEAQFPDGTREELLRVPFYDFYWQLPYILETPVELPSGTLMRATGWYDNSVANPLNPDPNQRVQFGLQVDEEMMLGYFDWYIP